MNDWIELNLPYSYWEYLDYPPAPDLREKSAKLFDKLPEALYADISPKAWQKYSSLVQTIEESILAEDINISNEDLRKLVREQLAKSTNPDIQSILTYRRVHKEYHAWLDEQPETKKWDEECEKAREAHNKRMRPLSFCGLGLDKPGVLIEVEEQDTDGNLEDVQYLIGDINPSRGVCDDCTAFDKDAIVKRYKVVWEKK